MPRHTSAAFRRTRRAVLALIASIAVVVAVPLASSAFTAPSAVTDVNPNDTPSAPFGGRVQALTIDPVNPQIGYAGSELGGLWKTTDGGLNWSHVDAVPLTVVEDVEIAPSDSNLVIATGDFGGENPSQGGIWRSTDGGATWSKPAGSDCSSQGTSTGIAIAPGTPGSLKVWVGDNCGVAYSADSGATWTHFVPNGMSGRVWDVTARQDGANPIQVDVCGDSGYARSTSGGATAGSFAAGTNPLPAGGFMPCTIDTAPNNPNIVFTTHYKGVNASGFCQPEFLQSIDGGQTWTDMQLEDDNCRNPWVVTHPALDGTPGKFDVFEGTGNKVRHQQCDAVTGCLAGVANWAQVDSGAHADPSDIAFDTSVPNGCPRLLSTDGGVYRTTVPPASCASSFSWGESSVGLHALHITQMAGTVNASSTDLYFGTQDNGIYYTGDGGASYTQKGPDVYAVFADHNPPARVLWRPCFGCSVVISNPGVTADAGFPLPPGDDVPNNFDATQFGHQSYAFITHDAPNPPPPAAANPNWTMYVTTNEGGSWAQMGPDPLPGIGPAGPLLASGPAATPTFYFMVRNGNTGRNEIYRMSGPFDTTPVPQLASNGLNFPTTFAVNPANPLLLYAYDTIGPSGRVMRSTNGGASWTEDTALDAMITRGGTRLTNSNAGPLVTFIGFDGNSNAILVGTLTSGIWASVDNGTTWLNVRGAQQLPRTAGFFFDERTGSDYAATAGRGLWRIDLPHSDLSLTKVDSPDPVIAGNNLTYTLTVHNAGPDAASGIVVKDTLPSQVSYVTSSGAPCTEAPVGTITCNLDDLPNGGTESFQIQVLVKANTVSNSAPGIAIVNNATVSSTETIDPNPADNSATASTIVNDSADLAVTKSCDAGVLAGQTGTCTIYVDNNGPSDARGVQLSDSFLSTGFFMVTAATPSPSGTCTKPAGLITAGTVSCNLGVIPAATTTVPGRATVVVQISANDGQVISDTASVRTNTPDPNSSNDSASASVPVSAQADLELSKSASPNGNVVAGTTIVYTISVLNHGPSAAANVVLADAEPAALTIVSIAAPGSTVCNAGTPGNAAAPTTCTFGSIPSGATRTMTVTTTIDPGYTGPLHNDARATSDTLDPNNGNNLAHTDNTVVASADVTTTKTATPANPVAGKTLNYKVKVTNTGPSVARQVTLDDPLPAGVTFSAATITTGPGTCTLHVGTPAVVHCELGDLAPALYSVISIDVTVNSSTPDGTVLHNVATAATTTSDPNHANDAAAANATVQAVYDRSIVLASDAAVYKPSTTIHYLITVADAGPSDAVGVVAKLTLPPASAGYYVSNDGGCPPPVAGVVTCNVGTLPVGTSKSWHVDWFVQGSKGTITSTASLNVDSHDPVSGNDTSVRNVLRK